MMPAAIIEQNIPVPSKKASSFVNAKVSTLQDTERSGIEQLSNLQEPVFSVVEDDRTYFYSFAKILKAMNDEISKLRERRLNLILSVITAFIISAVSVLMTVIQITNQNVIMVAFISFFMGCWCLYDLMTSKIRKHVKIIDDKKAFVMTESQVYLQQLKQEVQKPVIVI